MTDLCLHKNRTCLNPYELIRKYKCADCAGVMMCACEEDVGRAVLPHQLGRGSVYQTREHVLVTLGFQPNICNTCRGEPEEPAPMASIPGRTSKISQYYWRELFFETERRVLAEMNASPDRDSAQVRNDAEKAVLEEIKHRHATAPKYRYTERSQAEIINAYNIQVERLDARYLQHGEKGRQIDDGKGGCSPEDYAAEHYRKLGYDVFSLESVPFHVLFGVYMWILVQDADDEKIEFVSFGSRTDFDAGVSGNMVSTFLPSDFGSSAYAARRTAQIDEHFEPLIPDKGALLDLFDYWEKPSDNFRQYLWAHRREDVVTARLLVEQLPPTTTIAILRYLIGDYWGRFCGWPDLFVYRRVDDFMFVEVKSSNDKLSEDQKTWIAGNSDELGIPFRILKIHRIKA